MEKFDVKNVQLQGINLIEASAGTGKTYSVGILVIRLLLEQSISVKEILMVTFTDAAVEELKTRIRKFIYLAWQYSQGKLIDDKLLKELVDKCPNDASKILSEAMLLLDEISISTIHGFCTRTLKEFAFETDQNFDLKMVTDVSLITKEALYSVWRSKITTLHEELIIELIESGFNQEKLSEIVKIVANGKKLIDPFFDVIDSETILQYKNLEKNQIDAQNKFINYIKVNENELVASINNALDSTNLLYKRYNQGNILNNFDDFFFEFGKLKIKKMFSPEFITLFEQLTLFTKDQKEYLVTLMNSIYYTAAQQIVDQIEFVKKRRNLQSFDDLITNLHTAIRSSKSKSLCKGLQNKYKAVFIDEFQDTDKLQYEIFDTAFANSSTILFYIGDPKQSIYSFRKADLDTYKFARSKSNCFTMDVNFRSNQDLISNYNSFFSVDNPFNDNDIHYQTVKCGKPDLGHLVDQEDNKVTSLGYFTYKNKTQINNHVVGSIVDMLTLPYSLLENEKKRAVQPQDIGILVRSNTSGRELKQALGKKGIPAVVLQDSKIFQATEVNYVIYILEAINEINNNTINKAFATPLFIDHFEEISKINHEKEIANFERVKQVFVLKGVYSALNFLLDIYNLKNNLLHANYKKGNRLITNFLHITELLHHQQVKLKLSLDEMIEWLKRAQDGGINADSNFEQRLESDENAVNIVTIHKSKGLAYNIVFAPFLFHEHKTEKNKILTFKKSDNYVFSLDVTNEENIDLHKTQTEQESKRLIYVALTRAVYYCAIYGKEKSEKAPISHFTKEWAKKNETFAIDSYQPSVLNYKLPSVTKKSKAILEPLKKEFYKKWSIMSYSSISSHNNRFTFLNNPNQDDSEFENFVFKTMPKGTDFGLFIHYILENCDFADDKVWKKYIIFAAQKYFSWKKELTVENEIHLKQYLLFIRHIFNTEIVLPFETFKLKNVVSKLPEMQFYFDYKKVDFSVLQSELSLVMELEKKSEIYLEGLMNGFIDLVFELNNRFYILDWKTNYLGNSLSAYNQENMLNGMNVNNYHLQYVIYTIALVRYLKIKMPHFEYDLHFGGVLYLFVRGVREKHSTGIFYNRLTKEQFLQVEKLVNNQ